MVFGESSVAGLIYDNLKQDGITWSSAYGELILKGFMEGVMSYLSQVKKDAPKSFVVRNKDDQGGLFLFVIEKQSAEEGEGYTVSCKFDPTEDEFKDAVDVTDAVSRAIIEKIIRGKYSFSINIENGVDYFNKILAIIFQTIKEYLRNNLGIDPILEIPGFVKFEGSVENDTLKVNVVLDAMLKQIIKDDASVESAE